MPSQTLRPSGWQRAKAIYLAAQGLDTARRDSYVRRAAGDDEVVSAEVHRLLRLAALGPGADSAGLLEFPSPKGSPGQIVRAVTGLHRHSPGDVLAERYHITRFIARGGMGEVYEAEDRALGERIAIKSLRAELATVDHITWLRREVQAARRVQHPNVCRVFDLVVDEGGVFLTMELLEGETLAARLERDGAMTERQALPLVRQIVAGLEAAHKAGIVHRDLKPGNVMLVRRVDGPQRAVLMDFGLARQVSDSARKSSIGMTTAGGLGTLAYMAPEQIEGRHAATPADVYALGVILYEMLTGETPFSADSPLTMAVRKTRERPAPPSDLAPGLRPAWNRAILQCLEADPKRRPTRPVHVLEALEHRGRRWRFAIRALSQPRAARRLRWMAAGLATAAILAGGFWWNLRTQMLAGPADLREWDLAVQARMAGEPLEALRLLERAELDHRLGARRAADEALAWRGAGLAERAKLAVAGAGSDEFAESVRLRLSGKVKDACTLLAQRAKQTQAWQPAADLAECEQERNPSTAEPYWREVVARHPEHAAAHLRVAESLARNAARRGEAQPEFDSAQVLFAALGSQRLSRTVAGRRGMMSLEAGEFDAARVDLAGVAVLGKAACEHYTVIQVGRADHFAAPPDKPEFISPMFSQLAYWNATYQPRAFDVPARERMFAVSIPLPAGRICSGQLEGTVRRFGGGRDGSFNDVLTVGAAPLNASLYPVEQVSLWADQDPLTTTRDLRVGISRALFATVARAYADRDVVYLDVMGGDDTEFDALTLTVVY